MERPYPVIQERLLEAVPKRFLTARRRPLSDLPERKPGTALVLHVGGRCVEMDVGHRLTGAEEELLEATSVSVVDLRPRTIVVELNVPSADPADSFDIHVVFQATVVRADIAAQNGAVDLAGELRRYVRRDGKLLNIGSSYRVSQITEVRELVEARVEAYCQLLPYEDAPGLSVTFRLAEVDTPTDLRTQAVAVRNETWEQQIAALRSRGEDAEIGRMTSLVRQGPDALTALGLVRGEYGLGEAIRASREDEATARDHIMQALQILNENKQLDFVDAQRLVDSLVDQITRPVGGPSAADRRITRGGQEVSALAGARPRKENDENPPDENDLFD
ncbi:hypothetical protein [Kitasatospora sp. NPDC007106]|uniref:hypothetical protein n=1 Tax=unclassified Kitasatospora TaxID=2633591 RepID=UPI0034001A72